MAEMRCSISRSSTVAAGCRRVRRFRTGDVPRQWSLAGLQDYVRLSIGGRTRAHAGADSDRRTALVAVRNAARLMASSRSPQSGRGHCTARYRG